MGIYLNPNNIGFKEAVASEIYVDKTGLIEYTNKVFGTQQKYLCVSRPRRFGKTMAASMLTAYYSCGCDSRELFRGLQIEKAESFKEHLNQHDLIFLNIQKFLSRVEKPEDLVLYLQERVLEELYENYPFLTEKEKCKPVEKKTRKLAGILEEIYKITGNQFVFIIDEWDCIFREEQHDTKAQTEYLDFLRDLLKDAEYAKLTYMTGILPIKKYGSHSALNMFMEFSMTNPKGLAEYVGFTEVEVRNLCAEFGMDFGETKQRYDGYQFRKAPHVYSPKSVVDAMLNQEFDNYWTQTETYEALRIYIDMNFDGLKDSIVRMLSGERCRINTNTFANDMTSLKTRDDVLTLLIHLGYLAYDMWEKEVFIPNAEISSEFVNAIEGAGWNAVIKAIRTSEMLLEATWKKDPDAVAEGIDASHLETSVLTYNNENSLSCTITLAYYSARIYYDIFREMPTGEGFADIVFLPKINHSDKPAMIIELKWNKSAKGAINQMKEKRYIKNLESYSGNLLLVGINYNIKTKRHECVIESVEKN